MYNKIYSNYATIKLIYPPKNNKYYLYDRYAKVLRITFMEVATVVAGTAAMTAVHGAAAATIVHGTAAVNAVY